MADICYPVLSEHEDRDIIAPRRCTNCLNDYEDVFQIHFITAVCCCVISAEQNGSNSRLQEETKWGNKP